MITMRSTPKMGKPPPPVPPRPSKAIISEALAKSKKAAVDGSVPSRLAPPPPPAAANGAAAKPSAQRTVVFQSSDLKCSKVQVNLVRRTSGCKDSANKAGEKQQVVGKIAPETAAKQVDNNWNEVLSDRNHVNTLIDEMFASVLELPDEAVACEEVKTLQTGLRTSADGAETTPTMVVVVNGGSESSASNSSTEERKRVQFDDKKNHEYLISELEGMKKEQDRILKRQRKPSQEFYEDGPNIQRSDWVELSDGQEVRLSSCQITIEDQNKKEEGAVDNSEILARLSAMASMHGLPPLPKSLSGFSLLDDDGATAAARSGSSRGTASPVGHLVYPPHPKQPTVNGTDGGRKSTNLDVQLAILRKEMYSLRQLDLSLLSQLWSLNESIQDFRQILQEQDDRMLSPPSPSPTPSSGDDGEADEFYSPSPMRFRPAPPPPPLRRTSNSSSGASSVG